MIKLVPSLLPGFCSDAEEETERIQRDLVPERLLLQDSTALSLLHLDERINFATRFVDYLKCSMKKVEDTLFPGEELGDDTEAFLDRMRQIPD